MATLFEQLQARLKQQPQAQPGVSNIAEILKTKRTGQAVQPGAAPAATSIAQQVAQRGVETAVGQQQFAGQQLAEQLKASAQQQQARQSLVEKEKTLQQQLQERQMLEQSRASGQQIEAQEERAVSGLEVGEALKTEALQNTATSQLRSLTSARGIEYDRLFAAHQADESALENRADAASLEQKSFYLAMQDKDYLNELNRVAQASNLQNQIEYNREVNRLVFGNQLNNLFSEMGFESKLNADRRELENELTAISDGQMIEVARSMIKSDMESAKWQSIGTLASKGAEFATSQFLDEEAP